MPKRMAINATKPATPAAVADAVAGRAPRAFAEGPQQRLESAPTVPPPDTEENADVRIPPGTMISERYKIQRVLGEGGMGVVYSAEHVLMRKEVAVKVLHAEMCSLPEVVARFEREAIAAAHIDHPNVAGATDFGRLDDGACFLVLELLKGTSLRDEIAKGPISVGRSLRILRGIASGVSAAHAKGIVHRDLKPENVMLVERDGDVDFVKVLDFGIAKVDPATIAASGQSQAAAGKVLTRVGTVFGTPEYMAPEQAVGDTVDARADLYALGVIFLEMLTGKCPFTGNALSILRERILAVGPPDMSAIEDEGCKALVARLLTRQPDDRMQTGTELVAAIDQLLEERRGAGGGGAGTASVPPPAPGSAPAVNGTTNPVVATNPALITGPAAVAQAESGKSKRWIVIPIGLAAALLITFGTFALVKAVSAPAPSTTRGSASSAPSSVDTALPPVSAAVAPTTPAPSTSASSASVEIDDDTPTPTPTATGSAASARAAPRARPNPRPQQRKKKDVINIPNPFGK